MKIVMSKALMNMMMLYQPLQLNPIGRLCQLLLFLTEKGDKFSTAIVTLEHAAVQCMRVECIVNIG